MPVWLAFSLGRFCVVIVIFACLVFLHSSWLYGIGCLFAFALFSFSFLELLYNAHGGPLEAVSLLSGLSWSCLPCGHIFGAPCIQKWLQTNLLGMCPQCNILCTLKDVRPLYATPLCIPAADKGVADQKIYTRRFPFTKQGIVTFKKFEIGRRNFALKKRSDAKKRLAGVVGRKNDLMKRRTDLLDKMASVLNRAKALEQWGGSLCRVDALRLRADALGRWADEYLRRAKACEEKAKALSQRARAYNQRVKAFEVRLHYFSRRYDDLRKNTTHCAAASTCHKD
ncbi:zinc finger, RING/FYVE/PHD-type containing protein [Tanacetum coccineum]